MSAHVEWHAAERAEAFIRLPGYTWDGVDPLGQSEDTDWDDVVPLNCYAMVIDTRPENVAVFVGTPADLKRFVDGVVSEWQNFAANLDPEELA